MEPEIRDLAIRLIRSGAFQIRVFEEGEAPFLYSSGNYGPIFVSVKGAVSQPFFERLCELLAREIWLVAPHIDFVVGNATGGIVPSCYIAQGLRWLLGRHVPLVYIRREHKKGGQKELVTGIDNHAIQPGMNALIVEELVNYATTTTNSAAVMRGLGFEVTHGSCILSYDTEPARQLLADNRVELVKHFTLAELATLSVEIGYHTPKRIAYAYDFLADPTDWMSKRGIVPGEQGST